MSSVLTCPVGHIISSSKAAAEYTNGLFELGSPGSTGPLQVLQLVEDLRLALELQPREEERDTLRAQVPSSTAHMLMDWLDMDRCSERVSVNLCSPVNNESYQERLVRLEGDKESLVLQVSVLTDQVEAQGEKIRDLESSLEEHYHKLNSTEEMLQQELLSRTSLETQKLDLMDEVSYLKLKLVDMDEEQNHNDSSEDQQNKAECVVNLISELQEQMCRFQEEIHTRIMEKRAMEAQSGARKAYNQCPDVSLGGSDGFLQELRFLKSKVDELEGEKSQYEKKLKATKVKIYFTFLLYSSLIICQFSLFTWHFKVTPTLLIFEFPLNTYSTVGKYSDPLTFPTFCYITVLTKTPYPALTGKSERLDESTLSDLSPLSSGVDSGQQSPVSPENKKNHRGIKKLWGKIRKTQSGSLQGEDLEPGEFKRGGLRATAGPRLARAGETLTSVDLKTPFSKWTPEQVCCWLEEYGLGQYVILARHWADSGQTLLSASPQDLEKEMGIKNPLHRKKLQLALKSFSTKLTEKSSELDHIWVTRWLDDIGLPQYKDQFHQGRVDGRMLQYLTVNNLLFLKVTSQLHHLSVKCAIHVLHVNKFNPNCLKRRPGDENKTSPSEVVQWSNHRVMEWLRSVDLAEYAPNLRGSGVHGGLIILEPRFNSVTLAMLLNIPPQKTLLRRHLATNFNMLVGSQAQQEKREFMESSGYTPLSTTAKVRPKKLGFSNFGHLRKKRCDDSTDYICPLEAAQAQLQAVVNGAHRPYSGFRGLSPILDRDPDRREQVGPLQPITPPLPAMPIQRYPKPTPAQPPPHPSRAII
uniref:PPFIA binding protein 2 n=1 Tax=Hucho hucho TaxID=62062 RepID=A0A4W5JZ74_9TELE